MQHFCPQTVCSIYAQCDERLQRLDEIIHPVQPRLGGKRYEQLIIRADEILLLLGHVFIPADPVPLPYFRLQKTVVISFCQLIQLNSQHARRSFIKAFAYSV
ncbi:hypothetical protein D3C76_1522370 [compost metagenome]